jgi:hypothetical protein
MSLESMQNSINPIITKVSSFVSTNTPNYLKNGEIQTVALEQLGKLSKLVSENTPDSIKNNETVAYVLSNLEDLSAVVSRNTPKVIKENPIYASGIALLSLTAIRTIYLRVKNYIVKSKAEAALKLERAELEKYFLETSNEIDTIKSSLKKMRYAEMCMTGQGGKTDFYKAANALDRVHTCVYNIINIRHEEQ